LLPWYDKPSAGPAVLPMSADGIEMLLAG